MKTCLSDRLKGEGQKISSLCAWPARSQYLIVCDFFLWGYIEAKVYVSPLSHNVDDMKDRITAAFNTVDRDMLRRVSEEFSYWYNVRADDDGPVEHLQNMNKTLMYV